MRLPGMPLISEYSTGLPSSTNDNRSETSAFGCGATAIWNSNVDASVISTSSSAATSRPIASATKAPRWATLEAVRQRRTFSVRPAFRIPRRPCRKHFPAFGPPTYSRAEDVPGRHRSTRVPDRRPGPAVVRGFVRRPLVVELPNQLALRITQRTGDVRVLGDGYE